MNEFERKLSKPFTVESTDGPGTFQGLGAVFNDLHPTSSHSLPPDWQDRVMPGAFTKTLSQFDRQGIKPPMLYMHEPGMVIGAWNDLGEVGAGLHVKGTVDPGAQVPGTGSKIYDLMKMGALNAMSIRFRVDMATLDEKKKIRDLNALSLLEISVVDIPGIQRARITDVKSLAPSDLKRQLEAALREWGLSIKEAKAFIAEGFAGLRDAAAAESPSPRDAAPTPRTSTDFDDYAARLARALGAV